MNDSSAAPGGPPTPESGTPASGGSTDGPADGTQPSSDGRTDQTPPAGSAQIDGAIGSVTRLHRSDPRMVAGVSQGIGRWLGIDPVIPRILFAVLTVLGIGGAIAYGAAWVLLPDERTGESLAKRWFNLGDSEPQVRLVGLGVAAVIALSWTWGPGWGWSFDWLWLVAVLVLVWIVIRSAGSRSSQTPTQPPAPGTPPYGAGGAYGPAAAPPYGERAVTPPYGPPYDSATGSATGAASYGTAQAASVTTPAGPSGTDAPVPPGPPAPPVPPTPSVPPTPPPPKPRNPRHDSGTLTLATLSLAAIACGVAAIGWSANDGFEPSVLPAIVTGVIALGMLVGTVYGNARPLILPAILAVGVLGATAAVPTFDAGSVREAPVVASQLDDRYELGIGETVLDLRDIADLESLDGRTLEVDQGIGHIRILLPDDLDVDANADVRLGHAAVLGTETGGPDLEVHRTTGTTDAPDLTLDLSLTLGSVEVIQP
ncbi:UNVERIFIED_CONTAM: hypothetical protein LK11_47860 [Mumia flava]|nr:PspC domain-containing protein [Mumia flava]